MKIFSNIITYVPLTLIITAPNWYFCSNPPLALALISIGDSLYIVMINLLIKKKATAPSPPKLKVITSNSRSKKGRGFFYKKRTTEKSLYTMSQNHLNRICLWVIAHITIDIS
ncbi:MAG: hypothetical protein Q8Q23_05270 [bacterium]|nr:hypothetical protein [bacterium]